MNFLINKNIICFSTEDWDTPLPTNKKQIMLRLAENNRILFIQTIGIRKPSANIKDLKRIFRRFTEWRKGVKRVSKNIWTYSPISLPFNFLNLIKNINKFFLEKSLLSLIKSLRFDNPILWVYNPYAIYFIDKIKYSLLIYHCVDDLSLIPGADKEGIKKAEQILLEKTDIVFTTSNVLFEKCKKINKNTFSQPNVADFSHFNKADVKEIVIPAKFEKLKKPIITFYGNLTPYKIDFNLIDYSSKQLIDCSIAIIGPYWEGEGRDEINQLKKNKNIYFIGPAPYENLPEYLSATDLIILPYKINEATQNIFPLKFFESLATGKPVVSTPLPALSDYSNLIPMTDNYSQFVDYIKDLLQHDSPEKKLMRLELAKQNTWEKRIEEMDKIIQENCRDAFIS